MGRFTEEMTSLREDADSMSGKRASFINNLSKDVAELQSDTVQMQTRFRDDHQKMAEEEKKKRVDFLQDMTAYVADLQAGFRQERQDMAEKSTKEVNLFMSDIRGFVSDLGRTVAEMQDAFSKNRADMASTLRSNLAKSVKDTTDAVSHVRTATVAMQEAFRKKFTQESQNNQKNRAAFLTDLKNESASLQQTYNDDRLASAEKMKAAFALTKEELQSFITDLENTVRQMQDDFRKGRMKMAEDGRRDRHAFLEDIVTSVTDLKEQVENFRTTFTDDFAGIRATLDAKKKNDALVSESSTPLASEIPEDLSPTPSQATEASTVSEVEDAERVEEKKQEAALGEETGAKAFKKKDDALVSEPSTPLASEIPGDLSSTHVPSEEASTASEVEVSESIEEKKQDVRGEEAETMTVKKKDDLTSILGIGPGRLKQLNASGIFTFKQLGALTPDQLRTFLGKSSQRVDVTKWIEQAKAFA